MVSSAARTESWTGSSGVSTRTRRPGSWRTYGGRARLPRRPGPRRGWPGEDLAAEIGRLKQEPGKEIMAHGGAGFARSLERLGLVDEYRLLVHPVAVGGGLGLLSSLASP